MDGWSSVTEHAVAVPRTLSRILQRVPVGWQHASRRSATGWRPTVCCRTIRRRTCSGVRVGAAKRHLNSSWVVPQLVPGASSGVSSMQENLLAAQAQHSPDPLAGGEGAGCPLPTKKPYSRSRPFSPRTLTLRASPLTRNRRLGLGLSQHDWLDPPYLTLPWRRGVVVSGVRRINEVNARRTRLVPGWVTVFGRVYHLGM